MKKTKEKEKVVEVEGRYYCLYYGLLCEKINEFSLIEVVDEDEYKKVIKLLI